MMQQRLDLYKKIQYPLIVVDSYPTTKLFSSELNLLCTEIQRKFQSEWDSIVKDFINK